MRDKKNRNRKSRKPQTQPGGKPEARTKSHPLYGDIPLIEKTISDAAGGSYTYFDYDPDYEPPMPRGAVRGNVRHQAYCSMCHVPKYFYVDETITCLQCGRDFVFSGKEQKYWYEALRFNFHSVAIRCPGCRRRRRSAKSLRNQLALVRRKLEQNPDDPSHLLDLAEAIVRYRRLKGEGDLNAAIAAARRARRVWPTTSAPLYWEGACHLEAGRKDKAAALFREFLAASPSGRKYKPMVTEAKAHLATRDPA